MSHIEELRKYKKDDRELEYILVTDVKKVLKGKDYEDFNNGMFGHTMYLDAHYFCDVESYFRRLEYNK